jgi:cyclopropane fatty-acyl-phospholipid synthase-like methyltransferase
MKTLKEQFIEQVIGEVVGRAGGAGAPRVLELGCGSAAYVPAFMKQYPNVQYVGVEPIDSSYAKAKKNLDGIPNVTLHHRLGYDSVPDETEGTFDLVYSLSALEHIKQLDRFIAMAAKYVKPGGTMIHRYDLGHALQPHSLKEFLHVWLGNHVPALLPERQFVRYVDVSEVQILFEANGCTVTDVTYHQMPDHKSLEKTLRQHSPDSSAIDELFDWEMKHQKCFKQVPEKVREKLFPAITVWGEKVRGTFARG